MDKKNIQSGSHVQCSDQASAPSAPPSYDEACRQSNYNFASASTQSPNYSYNSPAQGPPFVGYPTYRQPSFVPHTNVFSVNDTKHTTVIPSGQYDAGARFTQYAPPTIPPPPPGCMPNAAQQAAAGGQTVLMNKKKGGFFKGSGSGGYTFW